MAIAFSNRSNAIRGFRQHFADIAGTLTNDMVRTDFLDSDGDRYVVNLEAVADYQADRMGSVAGSVLQGVPALRRSVSSAPVAKAHELFAALPAGTKRKDAIAAAVDAGIAYFTARTQYQAWTKLAAAANAAA